MSGVRLRLSRPLGDSTKVGKQLHRFRPSIMASGYRDSYLESHWTLDRHLSDGVAPRETTWNVKQYRDIIGSVCRQQGLGKAQTSIAAIAMG